MWSKKEESFGYRILNTQGVNMGMEADLAPTTFGKTHGKESGGEVNGKSNKMGYSPNKMGYHQNGKTKKSNDSAIFGFLNTWFHQQEMFRGKTDQPHSVCTSDFVVSRGQSTNLENATWSFCPWSDHIQRWFQLVLTLNFQNLRPCWSSFSRYFNHLTRTFEKTTFQPALSSIIFNSLSYICMYLCMDGWIYKQGKFSEHSWFFPLFAPL